MHGEEDERNVSDERDMEAITRGTTYDRRLMVQFFPHSTAIFSGSFPTVFHRAKRSGAEARRAYDTRTKNRRDEVKSECDGDRRDGTQPEKQLRRSEMQTVRG